MDAIFLKYAHVMFWAKKKKKLEFFYYHICYEGKSRSMSKPKIEHFNFNTLKC